MTTAEAREKIKKEWIDGFYEWLDDEANMEDMEFGKKYGWLKGQTRHKDNWEGAKKYLQYFFAGRYLPNWEKAGYERRAIWGLYEEGWLSYTLYSNSRARAAAETSDKYAD